MERSHSLTAMADGNGDEETSAPPAGPTRAAARKAAAEAAKQESPAAKSLAKPRAAKPAATSRTGGVSTGPKKRRAEADAVKAAARSGNPAKKAAALADSSRYTPPVPAATKVSPWYVPVAMFGFLALGMIIIFFNYIEWPLGDASNWRLLIGLGSILAGILVATRYH
jgi:hypothetical protein